MDMLVSSRKHFDAGMHASSTFDCVMKVAFHTHGHTDTDALELLHYIDVVAGLFCEVQASVPGASNKLGD